MVAESNFQVEVTARIEGLKPCTQYTFRFSPFSLKSTNMSESPKSMFFPPQDGEQTRVWGGGEGDHRAHLLRLLPTILPLASFPSFHLPLLPSPPPPPFTPRNLFAIPIFHIIYILGTCFWERKKMIEWYLCCSRLSLVMYIMNKIMTVCTIKPVLSPPFIFVPTRKKRRFAS